MNVADSLYKRLGGYDAIAAVADNLLPRRIADPQLGRFWKHRSEDGVRREKQLLIDFLCASAGGPLYYVGRDMKTSHRGLGITERDWQDRKSTRLNSSHGSISYAVFCLKKKKTTMRNTTNNA